MSKRKAEESMWDSHKEELHRLYETDWETLPFIIKHMKSRHGLDKSKPQYERVFKKWEFKRRNLSKKEWEFIVSRLCERESAGPRSTHVKLHGVVIPDTKIKKQRRNHEISTIDRQRLLLKVATRPVTPPGIEIYTPPISPAPQAMDLEPTLCFEPSPAPVASHGMAMTEDMQLSSADKTPWRQFLRAFSKLDISASQTSSSHSAIYAHDGGTALSLSALEQRVEDLLWARFLNEDKYIWIHPAVYDPTPFLAPRKDGRMDININSRHELSPQGNQIELLKHVVYLLSNNYNVNETAPAIVEFARDVKNREFLARLIKSGLSTAEAIAEKLLIPAAEGNNFPLLETLISSGVDINYSCDSSRYSTQMTLFGISISSANEDLFRFAIERGADPRIPVRIMHHHHSIQASPLDHAIRKANFSFVSCLLQRLEGYPEEVISTECDENSFIIAAQYGDVPILDLLISKRPRIFEGLRKKPWILYEAAALGSNIATLKALQDRGFDHRARSDQNQGSPVALALLTHNDEVADHLLRAGFNFDTYIHSTKLVDMGSLRLPHNPNTYAPIHSAIWARNIDMLHHLIAKGADPNQPGKRYPLQIAASVGNVEMVQSLLEAGACVSHAESSDVSQESVLGRGYVLGRLGGVYCTPQQDAVEKALEIGHERMFEILIQAGARLPMTASCTCNPKHGDNHEAQLHGRIWNPLLSAAKGENKKLFLRVLEIANTKGLSWMTINCILECMKVFDGGFVDDLIASNKFPLSAKVYSERLALSVKENAETTFQSILQTHKLSPKDMRKAFKQAVQLEREGMVSTFLEMGCWPDHCRDNLACFQDTILTVDHCYNASDILFDALNKRCIKSTHGTVISIMFEHYQRFASRAWELAIKGHFMKAYSTAILFEDTPIQMLAEAAGIDAVYSILRGPGWKECYVSAVQLAAEKGRYDVVNWLLDQGTDPDFLQEYVDGASRPASCLQHASRYGELSVVKRLLQKGVNVNAKPTMYYGATALQYAAITGRFDICGLLLNAGADVNAPPGDFEGRSAIEGAAEHGRMDMASYLLEVGAGAGMKGIRNTNYRRTVYRAWKHGHCALARMIHKWKAENDREYCVQDDSIEAILRAMTFETLVWVQLHTLETNFLRRYQMCHICVPDDWREEWLRGNGIGRR
ncbi:ankyrin [Karstenula rhodostoma CBS 690.94]|uniref:Ankyrin n=1 Tax=Karstenula rhodostoma CBS 690.94 TaxID=1392251 RepID=A0A9P4PU56_9PLEO|nr:ankyrin [Karstenula rhodostoma CBS 690.94]